MYLAQPPLSNLVFASFQIFSTECRSHGIFVTVSHLEFSYDKAKQT